jgi:hypothetical protein
VTGEAHTTPGWCSPGVRTPDRLLIFAKKGAKHARFQAISKHFSL